MTDRIRTTISLPPEVYDIFKRMAEAGGISVSRCMGDWLADTVEGALYVTQKMEDVRKAPMTAMREMRAYANDSMEEVGAILEGFRGVGSGALPAAERGQRGPNSPPKAPSSNTGLKSPKSGKKL
jgi:hypothetical protein